jgi:hypothetical protein
VTYYSSHSATSTGPCVFVFGGRRVATRRVVSRMYVLDLETLVWERLKGGEDLEGDDVWREDATKQDDATEHWPPPRYFHTADICELRPADNSHWHAPDLTVSASSLGRDKLVIFGGMGHQAIPSSSPTTASSSSTGQSPVTPEQPCVLADIHIFDCVSRRWLPAAFQKVPPTLSASDSSLDMSGDPRMNTADSAAEEQSLRPTARYAHLSAVSRDHLIVIGGQDLNNAYACCSSLRMRQTANMSTFSSIIGTSRRPLHTTSSSRNGLGVRLYRKSIAARIAQFPLHHVTASATPPSRSLPPLTARQTLSSVCQ